MKECANPRCKKTIKDGEGKIFYQPKPRLFSPRSARFVSKAFWLCDNCHGRVQKAEERIEARNKAA
jgi:hypothetical protein